MASQPADRTMHHVYLLRSLADPKQTYIRLTDDVRARSKSYNEGANDHAAK
jgi:predicted GIY-YIG superfamily endonuclease